MTLHFSKLKKVKRPDIYIYYITAQHSFLSAACEAHDALGVLGRAAEQTAVVKQTFAL